MSGQTAPMSQPMYPPAPVPPRKPSMWTSKPLIGVYSGLGGLLVGALMFSGAGGATSADPAPTVTVTATAPAPDVTEGAGLPTDEPTADEPAPYKASKSDWQVGVKVKEKQCFGEAGCNVTVTIDPKYVGAEPLPTSGTIEVTYELSGDTSGPVVGTFTVEDGSASFDKETSLDTKSGSVKIKAKVTGAEYNEG